MDINNQSSWAAKAFPMWTAQRERRPVLVVKTGFCWDEHGQLQPLNESDIPLEESERFLNDDPEQHSLLADLDLVPFKQGFELLLTGTAHFSREVPMFEVGAELIDEKGQATWHKSLRILGPHQWERTLVGRMVSKAKPIDSLPLQYEYAFGGQHPEKPEKGNQRNPTGLGHDTAIGSALPQIQQLPLITKKHQAPTPAGFGPVPRHWQPRLEKQKQLNAKAAETGACPYPLSVDTALYNSAPEDQQFNEPPAKNLKLQLKNLDRQQPLQTIDLPEASPIAVLTNAQRINLTWDTLIIDSDKKHIYQVWRGMVPIELIDMFSVQIQLSEGTTAPKAERTLEVTA